MDVSEKWGKSVDDAVKMALEDLQLTRDQVDVKVLEEPSRGFLGFGAKLALVRVERKKEEAPKEEIKEVSSKPSQVEGKKEKPKKKEFKHKNEDREKSSYMDKLHEKQVLSLEEDGASLEENREETTSEITVFGEEEKLEPCENHIAIDFLKEVTEQMGLDLGITAKKGESSLFLEISGSDSGTIIGKRGQTLDAIQYLTSLVVNKESEGYVRVVVDAENYRAKRQKTLEGLAKKLADKAVRTGRNVRLEPMNPYERKVIHASLQHNNKVTTRSEGKDPYRRVVIELK